MLSRGFARLFAALPMEAPAQASSGVGATGVGAQRQVGMPLLLGPAPPHLQRSAAAAAEGAVVAAGCGEAAVVQRLRRCR